MVHWKLEPHRSRMANAVRLVCCEGRSTTEVAESYGIPPRTLRRYVSLSRRQKSISAENVDSRQTLASRRKLLPVSPMIKPKALLCPSPLLDGENQVPGLHAFDVDAESGRKRWTIEPYRSRMLQALNLVGKGISKQKACNLCKVPPRTLGRYIQKRKLQRKSFPHSQDHDAGFDIHSDSDDMSDSHQFTIGEKASSGANAYYRSMFSSSKAAKAGDNSVSMEEMSLGMRSDMTPPAIKRMSSNTPVLPSKRRISHVANDKMPISPVIRPKSIDEDKDGQLDMALILTSLGKVCYVGGAALRVKSSR